MFYPTYRAKALVYDPRPNVAVASVAHADSGGHSANARTHVEVEHGRLRCGGRMEPQASPQRGAVLNEINNSTPSPVWDLNGWIN